MGRLICSLEIRKFLGSARWVGTGLFVLGSLSGCDIPVQDASVSHRADAAIPQPTTEEFSAEPTKEHSTTLPESSLYLGNSGSLNASNPSGSILLDLPTQTSSEATELVSEVLTASANGEALPSSPALQEDPKKEKVKIRFDVGTQTQPKTVKAEPASIPIHSNTEQPSQGSAPQGLASQDLAVGDKRLPLIDSKGSKSIESSASSVATESEKNQKTAIDWPKPLATLFITGQQHGYIEPCGCAGLENQKGGLNRRDTLLQMIRDRGWNVIPVDAGNQVRRAGVQAERQFLSTAEAFKIMDYGAVGFGEEDLYLNPMQLAYPLMNIMDGEKKSAFVSANVVVLDPSLIDQYKIFEFGGKKIAITAVIGDELLEKLKRVESRDLKILPAVESLKRVSLELTKVKCDYRILIAHTSLEESAKLAKAVPGFSLVVTRGFGEPEYKPAVIEGTNTLLIQSGAKGQYVGLLGLYDDPKTPFRYQRIALSSQFDDSPRMVQQFAKYQKSLKDSGLEGLQVRPRLHPSGREFVGSERCADCHTKAFAIWKDTPHAHATESLIDPPERKEIQRHFDPECLSCHVTGWNPQEFNPFLSGYTSLDATPNLKQSGCENCHGPGSAHVAAEEGDLKDTAFLAKLREEMRLPLSAAEEKCQTCHDIDNSPKFHEANAFEKYWEQVKHIGKD